MSDEHDALPPNLAAEFLSFGRDVDGAFEIVDLEGLLKFVAKYGERYPFLLELFQVDLEAVAKHFEETGKVPPGIKMTRKTRVSDKVTRLEILHGPIPKREK